MKKTILILIGLLILHTYFLVNLQFTAWPEMFSYAYLRNSGFGLYADMIHPYPPLLTSVLALIFSIFGYGVWVLQITTWFLILAIDILIFLIVRRLTGSDLVSLFSVLLFVLLQPFLEGNMLWFDLAIVAPVLLGLYYFVPYFKDPVFKGGRIVLDRKGLVMAGVFFGVAILIKQTAGLFLLIGAVYLLVKTRKIKSVLYLFTPPFVMGLVLLIWQIVAGTFEHFINWILVYPMTKWSEFSGYVQMDFVSYELIIIGILFLPILIVFVKEVKTLITDDTFQLIGLFIFGSLVAVYPRFSFFHFQLALALIVVMSGYLVSKYRYAKWLYITYLLIVPIVHKPNIAANWGAEPRFFNASDVKLSNLINEKIEFEETVFLLGLHSGIYSMIDNLPSKPWTDNFSWYLEIDGVQDWVINGWETNPPDKIVWRTPDKGNQFDLGVYQPEGITNWITDNYNEEEEISRGIIIWERKD